MPQKTYKKEFKGFQDFLGYEKVIRKFKQFEDTKKIIKKWKIVSKNQYKKLLKQKKKNMTMRIKLQGIPTNPELSYKSKWLGWNDFLGINK